MIHVDRLVTIELEPPVDLHAVEGLRFLLRPPNENDGVSHVAAAPEALGNIVFPLFVTELIHGNGFLFGHPDYGNDEDQAVVRSVAELKRLVDVAKTQKLGSEAP